MDLDQLRRLDVADQVTFLVGRSARLSVDLEAAVRTLVHVLSDPDRKSALPPSKAPGNFQALVTESRRRANEILAGDDYAFGHMTELLSAADNAYKLRNRFVHDLLSTGEGDEVHQQAIWERGSETRVVELFQYRTTTVTALIEACLELIRSTWRVHALTAYIDSPEHRDLWIHDLEGDASVTWEGTSTWTGPVELGFTRW
ncbi:hypothetical protein [Microbacterium resistens]|uniref:hypothetical protein n=1 Tax=Microbacterium resistens TaxID=156977 RepID=UPI00366DDE77